MGKIFGTKPTVDPELSSYVLNMEYAQARRKDAETGLGIVRSEAEMKTWSGGAKRGAAQPDWWMSPWKAWRAVLARFTLGRKYGVNNWKKALAVPRGDWHFGEDVGSSAVDYVRQFVAHELEHVANVFDLVDQPSGAVSSKGDDLLANAAAAAWNALCLVEYLIENEDLVREALSQYPEGHPKRRLDRVQCESKAEKFTPGRFIPVPPRRSSVEGRPARPDEPPPHVYDEDARRV